MLKINQHLRKVDYRLFLFGVLGLFFLYILYCEHTGIGYEVVLEKWGIKPFPYFVDLRILLCGVDTIRAGTNPYTAFCFNESIHFNYPYIWSVFSTIPFFSQQYVISIGFCLIFFSLLSTYFLVGKLSCKHALFYVAFLSSSTFILAFERGNSDLFIFILLGASLSIAPLRKGIGLSILTASFFKLFPIGALVTFFSNLFSKRYMLFAFTICSTLFFLYIVITKENIRMVSNETPRPFMEYAYGLGGIPSLLSMNFPNQENKIWAIYIALLTVGFIGFFYLVRNWKPYLNTATNQTSFLVGNGIFISSCLIGYNWEYRLIFLLFTIPMLLEWLRFNKKIYGILALILLAFWQSFIQKSCANFGINYLYVSKLVIIILFYFFLSSLLLFIVHRFNFINFRLIKSRNQA